MEERMIYIFKGDNVIFTGRFIESYKSIFEKKSFDELEISNLFYVLTHNNIGNIFSFLNIFNKCKFTSNIYGYDCKIFLQKISEKSILPRNNIYFNDIILAGKRSGSFKKDDSREKNLNHLEEIIDEAC